MKNLIALTTLALASLSATSLAAAGEKQSRPFCDLSSRPDIRSYDNPEIVARIDGRFDSTGRKWWWDVLWAPIVPFNAGWFVEGSDSSLHFMSNMHNTANDRHFRHYMRGDSPERAQREYTRLRMECRNHLRKHYSRDILFDDGYETVIAEHHFCSQPGLNGKPGEVDPPEGNGGGNLYSIWVMSGTPVYGSELTPEQKQAERCEKLTACYDRALNSGNLEQMTWVKRMNAEIGGCF
jgi:hypothetical protein